MSEQIDNGGPAFPHPQGWQRNPEVSDGMSLRDYFAGQALSGWLSGPCNGDVLRDYENEPQAFKAHQDAVAITCYGYADAMLTARKVQS